MRNITEHPSEAFESTAYPRIGLYIGGAWIYDREPWSQVVNPSTENELAAVPKATEEDLSSALASAEAGFRIWRDTPPKERATIILRAVGLLRERTTAIAQILSLENGKTLGDARAEIERCCNFYEWDAAQAQRAYGWIVPGEPQMQKHLLRRPIGPVVAVTPWNVPMSSAARKTSAALAAGCSIILKPAAQTPGTACALVRCFEDAGLPAGVLNLVLGDSNQISKTLVRSPITRLVTFTGSTQVGKDLAQLAGSAMKPVLMELGGNAPVIVGADADPEKVAALAATAKIKASGQTCVTASRFLVHQSIYARFVDALAEALDRVSVGDAFAANVQMGPVANRRRLKAVQELVEDARRHGARVATGGARIGERGYFFAPTVLADVPPNAGPMHEEPFAPLAACMPVPDIDTAIKIANGVPLGLAAYAFTNSLEDAEKLGRELDCGMLSVNQFSSPDADTPLGGIKDSGIGHEGGPTSLDGYLITRTVLQRTVRV